MKRYTRPMVVKVELNHEQAVLGTCSNGITDGKQNNTAGGCSPASPTCKASNVTGNSGALS